MNNRTPAEREAGGATKGQALLQRMAQEPDVTKGRIISSMAPGSRMSSQQPKVDICFVFDTTGSMSNKIQGLIECMTSFVDQLAGMNLDWRTTVVPFGDLTVPGDRVDAQLPFVTDVASAKAQLEGMPRFSGGSNDGESSIDAMWAGLAKPWRNNAVRILILLTDEPALSSDQAPRIDTELTNTDVICFVASSPAQYYKAWAGLHGGEWAEIGPSMETGSIVSLLRSLLPRVAKVAHDVHALAGGSVKQYLSLPPTSRSSPLPPAK